METRNFGIWTIAAFIMIALLVSPLVKASKKAEKEDVKPRVIVTVDGLT